MQLTRRNRLFVRVSRAILALTLLLGAGSCGPGDVAVGGEEEEEEFEAGEWMLGLYSLFSVGSEFWSLYTLQINADGTAIRTGLSGCTDDGTAKSQIERSFVWKSAGPDLIIITDPLYENDPVKREYWISPGTDCNQLHLAWVVDGTVIEDYLIYRGSMCPYPNPCDGDGCKPCYAEWCDGPPESCE